MTESLKIRINRAWGDYAGRPGALSAAPAHGRWHRPLEAAEPWRPPPAALSASCPGAPLRDPEGRVRRDAKRLHQPVRLRRHAHDGQQLAVLRVRHALPP